MARQSCVSGFASSGGPSHGGIGLSRRELLRRHLGLDANDARLSDKNALSGKRKAMGKVIPKAGVITLVLFLLQRLELFAAIRKIERK